MRQRRLEYFIVGLLVGGAAGVVIGLLFAPTSGAQIRQRIAGKATQIADVARGVAARAERAAEVIGVKMDHYLGRDEEVAWRKVAEIREGVQRYSRTVIST